MYDHSYVGLDMLPSHRDSNHQHHERVKNMSVVCKMFLKEKKEESGYMDVYSLGVVCRGDENKSWATATPSGAMKVRTNDFLAMMWRENTKEVEVLITPDEDGEWKFTSCAWTYAGCQAVFDQVSSNADGVWLPAGNLALTINASGATKVLRENYAQGLINGVQPRCTITFRNP